MRVNLRGSADTREGWAFRRQSFARYCLPRGVVAGMPDGSLGMPAPSSGPELLSKLLKAISRDILTLIEMPNRFATRRRPETSGRTSGIWWKPIQPAVRSHTRVTNGPSRQKGAYSVFGETHNAAVGPALLRLTRMRRFGAGLLSGTLRNVCAQGRISASLLAAIAAMLPKRCQQLGLRQPLLVGRELLDHVSRHFPGRWSASRSLRRTTALAARTLWTMFLHPRHGLRQFILRECAVLVGVKCRKQMLHQLFRRRMFRQLSTLPALTITASSAAVR